MLDFGIAEMIPLAKRGHARGSIHIKWMDSHIKRVHVDVRGAANVLIPRWFRYVSG
jgi:hypothetical protein